MSDYLENKQKQHRVIGIRHALKAFKGDGLIDDDTFYPYEAVDEIKDEILIKSRKWYKIGAKRGALELLDSIINGDFEVKKGKDGKIEVIAHVDEVAWNRSLNVKVGDNKKKIKKKQYRLKIEDLGFE
jgi:hypothetical protein